MPYSPPSRRAGRHLALSAMGLALIASCSGDGNTVGTVSAAPAPTPTPTPSPAPTTTAMQFAAQMAPGWNLGNALEAIGSAPAPVTGSQETAWGNPVVSQALLNAVAAAGFKSIRVPVAWKQYADADDRIAAAWFDRVAQVVDQARQAGMVVIINIH